MKFALAISWIMTHGFASNFVKAAPRRERRVLRWHSKSSSKSKSMSMSSSKSKSTKKSKGSSSPSYADLPGFHEASFPSDYIVFDGYGGDQCGTDSYLESHGYPLGVCQERGGLYYLNLAAYDAVTDHTFLAYQFYADSTCETALTDPPPGTFNWQGCTPRGGFFKKFYVGSKPEFSHGALFQTYPSEEYCEDGILPVDYSWQKYNVCTTAMLDGAPGLYPGGPPPFGTPFPYVITTCDDDGDKVTITAYDTADTTCTGAVAYTLEYDTHTCYMGTVSGETSGYFSVECL